ncbi:MAG: transglycosylase domain-containing protein [Candidatus Levyibacteriota bacterium]
MRWSYTHIIQKLKDKTKKIPKRRFHMNFSHIKVRHVVTFLLLISFVVGIGFLYWFVLRDIPTTATIGRQDFPQSSKIYDRHGTLLYSIYTSRNQTFVPLTKIPKNMQNATVAIEDKDFYKHGAIDIRGIMRAAYSTLVKKQTQGGSTITQQLVKTSLLTLDQTIQRKVKEIILSYVVEATHSKSSILEMYLNQVPYGGTAYGVQAASYVYFDKPVWQLSLPEAAFLAGLPEAPSLYSPFGSHPELGMARQHDVLQKMYEQKYISKKQLNDALKTKLTFSKIQDKILAPHFVFYVKDLLVGKYGEKMVEQGGLQVTTSLDLDIQNYAQASVSAEIDDLEKYNVTNGAAMVTEPATGEVLAMVGSRDYFDSKHDGNVNVALAHRQPGSSIKPINYATGLAKGYTAATPFVDEPTCFENGNLPKYCPVNYDGKFHGVQQMRFALGNSFNIPAVKMLKLNGIDAMIATASAMGISTFGDSSRYGLSLTLGGGEVTMLDMTEAFGVFANGGYKVKLQPILKVTDSSGKVLEQYNPPSSPIFGEKVLPPGVSFIMSHMLMDNNARLIEFGGVSPLKIKNYPISVKTGTTNDFRDNWTIGYTSQYVVAVWVGNNNNTAMNGIVSGITGAAPIWHDIMAHMVESSPPQWPIQPDNVVGRTVCADSGLMPPADGCPTRYEYFIKGTEPQIDPGKQKVFVDKDSHDLPPKGKTDNLTEEDHRIVTDPTGDRYCVDCPHPTPSPTPTP